MIETVIGWFVLIFVMVSVGAFLGAPSLLDLLE
jgi:hypothetical protein